MRYLSVCSGIEAATVAWHGLGWKAAGFAEIEKFPSAVLKERFPDVTNYGDMTKFKEWENVGTVDLLVGGTPCQSFSVAGLRKGLTDPRGNLMLTFGAIASHFKARWIVWENVPGVLSSNRGRDFGAFLAMLAECGYGFAYRVLDAQFFGVPQRRRRVFVVGCLGNWLAPAKVLFDSESLSGNPPPSREKGKGIAFNAQGSASQGLSAGGITPTLDKSKVPAICLMDQGGSVMGVEKDLSGTLRAQSHGNEPVVCYGLPGNWINRKPENGGNATAPMVDLSPCITGMDRPAVCIPLDMREVERSDGKAKGVGIGDEADPAYTVTVGKVHAVCYENHGQDRRIKDCGELSPSISAKAGTGGGDLPLVQEVSCRPKFWNGNDYAECLTAKGADDRMPDKGRLPCVIEPALHGVFSSGAGSSAGSIAFSETTSPTLKSVQSGNMAPSVHLGSQVRRLTPKECERLQGFPDDWTRISWRGKLPEDCPDGPRYKACGNSMAVPVMRWIGERINKQEKEQK